MNDAIPLIIKESMAPGLPVTYVLGCYSKRVTILSQQNRAFNLIWALFETKIINENSSIGVVGGGIAGISAAAAAILKGCKVSVYEQASQLMHLQKGNFTRYLHPNLYDWPTQGTDHKRTELPGLNWSAGITNQVAEEIETAWKLIQGDAKVELNCRVSRIVDSKGKPRVEVSEPFNSFPHDCVILAVGFGIEKAFENVRFRSYWAGDDIHQEIGLPKRAQRILVSGCGDGGLIDVMRLTLTNFNHTKFTEEILSETSLNATKMRLLEIEQEALKNADDGYFLFDQYKKLSIPESVLVTVNEKLRKDRKVILNSNSATFLNHSASVLNRFTVFMLQLANVISYKPGTISSVHESEDKTYEVTIVGSDSRSEIVPCDDIIIRHGPEPVICNLVTVQKKSSGEADFGEFAKKKYWPDDFYTRTENELVQPSREIDTESINELRKYPGVSMVGVSGSTSNQHYLVFVDSEIPDANLLKIKSMKGVPVKVTSQAGFGKGFKFSGGRERTVVTDDSLSCGSMIANGNLSSNSWGRLSCFVTSSNGRTCFISAAHALGGDRLKVGDEIETRDESGVRRVIGRVLAFSIHDESDYNLDSVIATLDTETIFYPGIAKLGIKFKGTGIAELGQRVYNYGVKNVITSGVVESIYATVKVDNGRLRRIFKDCILIRSNSGNFSSPGDSGSLVYDDMKNAIGVVIGISSEWTLIMPIDKILSYFNCRMFTG